MCNRRAGLVRRLGAQGFRGCAGQCPTAGMEMARSQPAHATAKPSQPGGTHQLDVVIDGLGHPHHVAHHALRRTLLGDGVRSRVAAIAANHVAGGPGEGGRGSGRVRRRRATWVRQQPSQADTCQPQHARAPCRHKHSMALQQSSQVVDAPEAQPLHNGGHLGIATRRTLHNDREA